MKLFLLKGLLGIDLLAVANCCSLTTYYPPAGMAAEQVKAVKYECDSQTAALIGANTPNYLVARIVRKQCLKAHGFATAAPNTSPVNTYALTVTGDNLVSGKTIKKTAACFPVTQRTVCESALPTLNARADRQMMDMGWDATVVYACEPATTKCQADI